MQPRWIPVLQDAADTVEVEIKVKTKWGKYSMFQDTYTHTEKYHAWDRANRRSSV